MINSFNCQSRVKQRTQDFSRVTVLVLAVGCMLTLNPCWVTGVCLACRGRTGRYIAPQTVKKPYRATAEQRLTVG